MHLHLNASSIGVTKNMATVKFFTNKLLNVFLWVQISRYNIHIGSIVHSWKKHLGVMYMCLECWISCRHLPRAILRPSCPLESEISEIAGMPLLAGFQSTLHPFSHPYMLQKQHYPRVTTHVAEKLHENHSQYQMMKSRNLGQEYCCRQVMSLNITSNSVHSFLPKPLETRLMWAIDSQIKKYFCPFVWRRSRFGIALGGRKEGKGY